MLKRCTELQLETVRIIRQTADIMQRVIAETVELMQFALIHGVIPIDLKELLRHRRNTVHIIRIKSDDTRTEDIRDIAKRIIFGTLER